jgi:hypothetical protein
MGPLFTTGLLLFHVGQADGSIVFKDDETA